MSNADNPDNYCYKHPNRESYVLCQRCARTVCPDCQTQAPVGVICPECMDHQRKTATPQQRRAASMMQLNTSKFPPVTTAIVGVTGAVGVAQLIAELTSKAPLDPVTRELGLVPAYLFPQLTGGIPEAWRVLSYALVHGGILHFVFNMFFLWVIGGQVERMLGRSSYIWLYVLGALGGATAATLLSPGALTVGASGALFGLLGAMLILGWKAGQNMTSLLVLIGLNLAIGFMPGVNISWQGHIGGAVAGMAVAGIIYATPKPQQKMTRILLLSALGAVLLLLIWLLGPGIVARFYGV